MTGHVFISHSTRDDDVVRRIRSALEGLGVATWVDSRRLTAGDALEPAIRQAIDGAAHFVAVLSTDAMNSPWVAEEIRYATAVQRRRDDGFKVIPVLLDPVKPAALPLWFDDEPVGLRISTGASGIAEALPELLAGLGLRRPTDHTPAAPVTAAPIADLVLELEDPTLDEADGKRRAAAVATLVYKPADGTDEVRSRRFRVVAPLGPIETEELSWYLERYAHWPSGVFRERARAVEAKLSQWGGRLYETLTGEVARPALEAWRAAPRDAARRFSVLVDADPVAGTGDDKIAEAKKVAEARESATLLLSLPWELTHDGRGFLFQGRDGVRVRRRLPNRGKKAPVVTAAPIRVLLVSPRPEDDKAAYIDHRVSARPLAEALATLGELAELTLLDPPTFQALDDELRRSAERGTPYHVLHFDGHGVFDRQHGLGALCFEHPADAAKLTERRSEIVDAERLAAVLKDDRVPLVFLEACQSAATEDDPTASVAGKLLAGGVASVVAMSHSVLVETARRFVTRFYRELVGGAPVGRAMVAGQNELKNDTYRLKVFRHELHLEDWFVPVLFQEELDPPLLTAVPAEDVRRVEAEARRLALGRLPEAPEHGFVGRSRELLAAERLLAREPWVVLRGEGGEGKTTLAAELARWLVLTRRFRRAAFVSLELDGDARRVLWALGDQLVPGFLSEAGQDEERARQLVERALADPPTLIVLDNMESVLPPAAGSAAAAAFEPEILDGILELCRALGRTASTTRLIFTSREALPSPFGRHPVEIGRLDPREAVELVGKVLGEGNLMPHAGDPGESEDEIARLVDAVGGHARSLVLLAGEVVASGVRHATERLHELMAALAAKYPDDRQRSLFASVELSLRRLPEATRRVIRPLGVFQGGAHGAVMAMVLGLDYEKDEEVVVGRQLVDVGLAEAMPYGYLRLHPALAPALLAELTVEERDAARRTWVEATEQLTRFLYQQQFKDARQAATLTLLDLPNLLAGLEHLHETAAAESGPAERVVDVATRLEGLLQNLGRPRALVRSAEIRHAASGRLGEWSHARFIAESAAVDRWLDAGRFAEAVDTARKVLERSMAAGEDAYEVAVYDLAAAHFRLGRALRMGGASEAALAPLGEAGERFRKLADAGNEDAARMAAVSVTESGGCLLALGRLDAAATVYATAIRLGEKRNDPRAVAVSKGQLGTVRMHQRKYDEALAAHTEAREIFEGLGEPGTVAGEWHQIAMVHSEAGQYESAERAYQQSLKINVQRGDRRGEASTLNELGNLYDAMGRLEESVSFYRQAAAVFVEVEDLINEGRARNNVADTLILLQRYDEARGEIERAIECKEPYGHAAQPWNTFMILSNLERAVGDDAAAAEARERAVRAYLAYRRAGGENQSGSVTAQLCGAVA
ncbi:MAG: CHAT domain-containing protein, partial [Thermoanaerobaculia bacterium]